MFVKKILVGMITPDGKFIPVSEMNQRAQQAQQAQQVQQTVIEPQKAITEPQKAEIQPVKKAEQALQKQEVVKQDSDFDVYGQVIQKEETDKRPGVLQKLKNNK
jgi:hypothetical protein